MTNPGELIEQALRVSANVAVGFVNHGYWVNRLSVLRTGSRPTNVVFPLSWEEGRPYNPVTVRVFTEFASRHGFEVANAVFLKGTLAALFAQRFADVFGSQSRSCQDLLLILVIR